MAYSLFYFKPFKSLFHKTIYMLHVFLFNSFLFIHFPVFSFLFFPSKLQVLFSLHVGKNICKCRLSGNKLGKLWHIFVLFAYVTHELGVWEISMHTSSMLLVPICIASIRPKLSVLSNMFACAAYIHTLLKQEHLQC